MDKWCSKGYDQVEWYIGAASMDRELEDPEKNQISIDLSKTAHENIQLEVTYLIELFCKNQKSKFLDMSKTGKFCQGEPEDEETDHLLGYLNTVLKFLHNNLDLEQEDLNLKYQAIIKERLFDILDDEIIKNVDNKKILNCCC